jgi:hypothetical protein
LGRPFSFFKNIKPLLTAKNFALALRASFSPGGTTQTNIPPKARPQSFTVWI